jgi:hypothetical protein
LMKVLLNVWPFSSAGNLPLATPKEMLFACAVAQYELQDSYQTLKDIIPKMTAKYPNLVSSDSVLTFRFGSKVGSWNIQPLESLSKGQQLSVWADVFDAVTKSKGALMVVRLALPSIWQSDDPEESVMDLSKALVAYCAVARPDFWPVSLGSAPLSQVE